MVKDTVYELEGYKAKVQEAIDHVASGVSTLNEDQVEKAKDMLDGLEEEFHEMKMRALDVLNRPRPVVVPVESRVKRFRPEGRMVEDPRGPYRLHEDEPEMPGDRDGIEGRIEGAGRIDGPARVDDTYTYNPDGPAVLDVVEAGELDAEGQPIREETYVPGPNPPRTGFTSDTIPGPNQLEPNQYGPNQIEPDQPNPIQTGQIPAGPSNPPGPLDEDPRLDVVEADAAYKASSEEDVEDDTDEDLPQSTENETPAHKHGPKRKKGK
jgi:hypothetical protein